MCASARCMDYHPLDSIISRCHVGSQTFRSYYVEGQSTPRFGTYKPNSHTYILQIIYDLDQVPREALPALRDSILTLLNTFQGGPRPIRTQLSVCLANLAIQMTEWKDVIPLVGSTLGNDGLDCTLEFLRVLPEEVTEGRKINLTVCRAESPSAYRHIQSTLRAKDISI